MTTTFAKTDRASAKWWVVDASKETLGRMATQVARILMGKHRPTYTPNADTGDFVVVVNARDVQVTGRKATDKLYHRHTRYPGGQVVSTFAQMREKHPEDIVRLAVRRMLPKTTLGSHMLRKLKIYPGAEHPHQAQGPETLGFGTDRTARGARRSAARKQAATRRTAARKADSEARKREADKAAEKGGE